MKPVSAPDQLCAAATRDIAAIREAGRRRPDAIVQTLVGEMKTELVSTSRPVRHMIAGPTTDRLCADMSNAIAIGRTLAGRAAIRMVEKAMVEKATPLGPDVNG